MRRCRPHLSALILLLLILACGTAVQPLPRVPADGVILAFGDSITYGTGAEEGQSYPEVLARQVRRRVISSGVPGETSALGLRRLPAVLNETRPQLVVLCHGGNDLLGRLDPAQTAQNLRLMIQMIREKGAASVLIAVPQPGLLLSPAPLYETVAREMKVPLEDRILGEILADGSLKADFIHPNARGYARLAGAVASLLRRYGAVGD